MMLKFLSNMLINAYVRKAKRLKAQADARMVAARALEEKRISLIKAAQADDAEMYATMNTVEKLEDIFK